PPARLATAGARLHQRRLRQVRRAGLVGQRGRRHPPDRLTSLPYGVGWGGLGRPPGLGGNARRGAPRPLTALGAARSAERDAPKGVWPLLVLEEGRLEDVRRAALAVHLGELVVVAAPVLEQERVEQVDA